MIGANVTGMTPNGVRKFPAIHRDAIAFLAISFALFLAFMVLSETAAALAVLPIVGAVVTAVYAARALTSKEMALVDEYALHDFHIAEWVVALAASPRPSRSPVAPPLAYVATV